MKPIDILNKHNLKRTSCREGIIDVIMTSKHALSENEIREKLTGNYDRTTFYRSFKTLEDKKIIHKIVVDNKIVKYALIDVDSNEINHAHFYCNDCNSVKCLKSVIIQNYQLPEGYVQEEKEVIIKGRCADCKSKED